MCTSNCKGSCINISLNKISTPTPCIKLLKQKQLLEPEYEKEKILLNLLKDEIGFLILKLSNVVDGKQDKEFILKAEHFHNEFITRDEYIKELKSDIKEQLQLIKSNEKLPYVFFSKHQKLRNEINSFEKNFLNLKMDFDQLLSEHLSV